LDLPIYVRLRVTKVVQPKGCNPFFGRVWRENGGKCSARLRYDHGDDYANREMTREGKIGPVSGQIAGDGPTEIVALKPPFAVSR
jgi:hypothetical protein